MALICVFGACDGDGGSGGYSPKMVSIPAGKFTTGGVEVTLTKGFLMSNHEVTQAEWSALFSTNPSNFQGDDDNKKVAKGEVQENRPVECVSWYGAIAYCNKLSLKESLEPCYSVTVSGNEVDWANLAYSGIPTNFDNDWNAVTCDWAKTGYRLPTEAEWEYAARGGQFTHAMGNVWAGTVTESELKNYAWYGENSDLRTHEVGKKSPNGYGLYDMSGNVWEWCWDWYSAAYPSGATDPKGAAGGSDRAEHGGGWKSYTSAPSALQVFGRSNGAPYTEADDLGFRLVRSGS